MKHNARRTLLKTGNLNQDDDLPPADRQLISNQAVMKLRPAWASTNRLLPHVDRMPTQSQCHD